MGRKNIPDSIKAKAVDRFLNKGEASRKIGKSYGVSPTTVKRWADESVARTREEENAKKGKPKFTMMEVDEIPAPEFFMERKKEEPQDAFEETLSKAYLRAIDDLTKENERLKSMVDFLLKAVNNP